MKLCDKNKCTGCGACFAACSLKAINMCMTENGFLYPEIDETLCVECGKCVVACPGLNTISAKSVMPTAWVAKITDKKILWESASGGMFTALAEDIIKNGGVVFGVVWDEDNNAVYSSVRTEEELLPMRGSKYVQSFSADIYPEVKKALDENKQVLFTGVPCQIAGLYGYLGNKDYDSLYTVDIVCHGGGSPGMFKDYLKWKENAFEKKIARINHTDKGRDKWSVLIQKTIRIECDGGEVFYADSSEDAYLSLFLNGYIYREVCYSCNFASMPRVADITLGDFFGFGTLKYHNFDVSGGVSQVIVNTEKGKNLFDRINKSGRIKAEQVTMYECMIYNHNLWKPSPKSAVYNEIMYEYSKHGFSAIAEKYYASPQQIKNRKTRALIKKILGDRLTALGMGTVYKIKGTDKKIHEVLKRMES